jgi:deoxycytidine triphosphate deaminase
MGTPAASVLSDGTILQLVADGRIVIDPWEPGLVQPASVDLRLGDSFRVFHNHRASAIDLRRPPENLTEEVLVPAQEPFVIHPGEFCLGRTLEWVELPGDIVARIEGKALALDTPVPTPDGWRTMGGLRTGDLVFAVDGRPTPVIATSEVLERRPCRRVSFSDGTTIVADVDHQWLVLSKRDTRRRNAPTVVRTGEIERLLRSSATEHSVLVPGARRIHVPQAGRVHVPGARRIHNARAVRRARRELALAHPVAVAPRGRTGLRLWTAARPQLVRRDGMGKAISDARYELGKAITEVVQCESVPVKCIEVGAPDGMFLVSRSFIPTHNSSLGRLGLIVHATAGFCDPGWRGTLTLELNNLTRVPIKLYPGLPIAQLSFMALDRPALRPYGSPGLGSHYQGQRAATESRYEGGPAKGDGAAAEAPDRRGSAGAGPDAAHADRTIG